MAILRKKMLGGAAMPVGSFMWWFGLESKIPEGWLKLDGSSFDATKYPELYDILGSTRLPNMIDKFIKGGNTGGVSQNAGLPNPSVSASLSNLTFTGTAKNISLSGTPSGTISGGDHTHNYLYPSPNSEPRDSDNDGGYAIVTLSKSTKTTTGTGAHTHTFTGSSMTLSGSYTPSGSVSGSVSVSVGSTSIYGKSDTVTPANVSAIPIIKAV